MKTLCPAAIALLLSACNGSAPNHVGNPASLPIRGLSNGIENGIYSARRNRVKTYVSANHAEIKAQIGAQGGPALMQSYKLAKVPQDSQAALTQQLYQDRHIYLVDDPEPLVVALMVHGP